MGPRRFGGHPCGGVDGQPAVPQRVDDDVVRLGVGVGVGAPHLPLPAHAVDGGGGHDRRPRPEGDPVLRRDGARQLVGEPAGVDRAFGDPEAGDDVVARDPRELGRREGDGVGVGDVDEVAAGVRVLPDELADGLEPGAHPGDAHHGVPVDEVDVVARGGMQLGVDELGEQRGEDQPTGQDVLRGAQRGSAPQR